MDAEKTGTFIAGLRKEQGLTQKQLADKLLVSDKAVSRWETGKGFPNVESLVSIGDLFSVSVNELLMGERVAAEEYKNIAESNIVETCKKERRTHRHLILTVILASAFTVIITCAVIVFAYIYVSMFTVHVAAVRSAENYPETTVVKGKYILQTVRLDNDYGVPSMTFAVLDEDTGECLFKTDELWRTVDLNGIEWDPYSYNIIVDSSDVGTYIYEYDAGMESWNISDCSSSADSS